MATKLREPNDIWIDDSPHWSTGRMLTTSAATGLALWGLLILGLAWILGAI